MSASGRRVCRLAIRKLGLAAAIGRIRTFRFEPARSREIAALFTLENSGESYMAVPGELHAWTATEKPG